MLAEFEARNRNFRPYFCGVRKPFVLAFLMLGADQVLFILGQVLVAWISRTHPASAHAAAKAVSLGETLLILSGMAVVFRIGRHEFFNLNFIRDFRGALSTGALFSTFFVFIIFVIAWKPEFRAFLIGYYERLLLGGGGDTLPISRFLLAAHLIVSSVFEEIVFRALLLKYFSIRLGLVASNALITALFVSMHFIYHDITAPALAGWTLLSFSCGIALFKTNGWIAPSLVHVVYNSRFFLVAPFFLKG